MSSTRSRKGKRTSKSWDESNYEEDDDEMEEEFEEEFEEDEELEEGDDDDVEMEVSDAEIEETEEVVELDDYPRQRDGQVETYEVDSIIERKIENGREMFLIQWKGYSKPTWEPRENLDNCTEALDSFYSLVKLVKDDDNLDSKPDNDLKNEKWKASIKEAYEASKKFDYEIYDKYILRRGLIEVGEGYKIENVPFANIAGSANSTSRQNSVSSSKG